MSASNKRLVDLTKTLKALKRQRDGTSVCPRCGSSSVARTSSLDGWLVPDRFVCEECRYVGYLVLKFKKAEDEDDRSGSDVQT